eukprot:SM000110S18892  [mRNA]  locus=s110:145315:146668:- [translate_table: standard]
MSLAKAATVARGAEQQRRVRALYRHALKTVLSYAVQREVFYDEADKLRERFEANKHEANRERVDYLLETGERRLEEIRHPDPYTVPWAVGGSKYARNPPIGEEVEVVHDYGRQEEY